MIESYLLLVAEEVRRLLASLGLRSFEEAVGRVDLLRRREDLAGRAAELVIDGLLEQPQGDAVRYAGTEMPRATGGELGKRVADEAVGAPDERVYEITNHDRTVGAMLGGRLAAEFPEGEGVLRRFCFVGHAGQSFGAFLPRDVEFVLDGEANDYVGKSLSGGRIVIRPPSDDAGTPCLVGNTCLYGATSGELYCAGSAGARFAVRNSGATAVVEGVGDNACEYMTNGVVVILGDFGRNLGAGMSGGEAFVHDPAEHLHARLNDQLVVSEPVAAEAAGRLKALLERHVELTGSAHAAELLARWGAARDEFRHIRPKDNIARIEAEAEGTEHHDAAEAEVP
jgi:glutamate synthase (ferredoxin)